MLTGDKIETAKCIAISTGLKSRKQEVVEISNLTDWHEISQAIDKWSRIVNSTMLMIDGKTLAKIVADDNLKHKFFETSQLSQTVCVCRCSPTQKAIVAENITEFTGCRIACVGDGGNDVAMIQKAHVGLGIVGKEGMQASLAADFSIL